MRSVVWAFFACLGFLGLYVCLFVLLLIIREITFLM